MLLVEALLWFPHFSRPCFQYLKSQIDFFKINVTGNFITKKKNLGLDLKASSLLGRKNQGNTNVKVRGYSLLLCFCFN